MTYDLLRDLAVASIRSAMEVAEVATDAGTRDPLAPDDGPDPDEAYDRMREKDE